MEKQIKTLVKEAKCAQQLLDLTCRFAGMTRNVPDEVLKHQAEVAQSCRRGAVSALELSQILESIASKADAVIAESNANKAPPPDQPGKVHVTLSTGRTVVLTCVSDTEWSLELPSNNALTESETVELGSKLAQLHRGRCSTCSCGDTFPTVSTVSVDITLTEADGPGDRATH
ncbi:hypothetical protein [Methyloversatilis discipulorum]|uniref:hypothetical protein n=1 Tax=Methyloversatilis discipulorum TaxID=1119528 RepID=UPI0003608392|nr:hypothetical protein [Methyloversatilis discipulorum]